MFVTLLYFFSELKNLPSFLILFVTVRTNDKGLKESYKKIKKSYKLV